MVKNSTENTTKISLTLSESLLPIILLIILLSFNVYVYGDDAMSGSNQFIFRLMPTLPCWVRAKSRLYNR